MIHTKNALPIFHTKDTEEEKNTKKEEGVFVCKLGLIFSSLD